MGLPWLAKKYIDEIFCAGGGISTYASDGRTRSDPSKTFGSGGLMHNKRYMLSFTYNCPESEFDNPKGFYDGHSMEVANIGLHKTFQFCAATPYPSFAVYDVHKSEFDIDGVLNGLNEHLEQNIK